MSEQEEAEATPEGEDAAPTIIVRSVRFGEFEIPEDRIISIPSGMIGFSRDQKFVMLDHKPPFSWLQSCDDPALAFVVVDGFEFGDEYKIAPPIGDKDIDLKEDDEFAILVIVTVRPDPKDTTANLKAPIFVNLRNMKGVQIIFDHPNLSTRFPLWVEQADKDAADPANAQKEKESEKK